MSRYAVVAATAIAAVVLLGVVIGITHPFSNVGAEPTPTAIPSLGTPAANLGEPIGNLSAGTYRASAFTEPFTVVIPAEPSALSSDGPAVGDLWSNDKTLRIKLGAAPGNADGALTFHDDVTLAADVCDGGKGAISDVPTSVEAVGSWLTNSAGLNVGTGTAITVDGRQAMSWDIALPAGCGETAAPSSAVVYFSAGERHRVYAIPTGSDTIIAFTWGSGTGGVGDQKLSDINSWADELVAAMRFN